MRRLMIGLCAGLAVAATVYAAPQEKLHEIEVKTASDEAFVISPDYGRLVSVVTKSEVQYLYFEAQDGTIHIVLMGTRGALQQARSQMQLLTTDAFAVKRRESEVAPQP